MELARILFGTIQFFLSKDVGLFFLLPVAFGGGVLGVINLYKKLSTGAVAWIILLGSHVAVVGI